MSLTQFYIWFPAIVVALLIAVFWDCFRRRFWTFADRYFPGLLREVGIDSRSQSREEAEDHHLEVIKRMNILARMVNLLVSDKLSNFGATTAFDIEAQTEINAHYIKPLIHMTETSAIEGTCCGEINQDMDWEPVTIPVTSYLPSGASKDVIRPAKRLYERHANGRMKRAKSSIILQASIVIDPWVLVEIVELAKHCIQKENRCIFQLGNWAILYYNVGKVKMHLLKESDVPVNIEARWQARKMGIMMHGLHLIGSQVKVGTKQTSKVFTSDGPTTQGVGDLDKLYLPIREFDVLGEDSLIYASKVVVVDGVSLIVRSEASFILPPQEKNTLIEAVWTQWLWISNSTKKMVLSLLFGIEDFQPECATNCQELEFDPEQLKLHVEHLKGLSQIELLNTRKEVLLYLQEQRASGIVKHASPPSPHSDLIFVRDEHYLECWQEGLRILNEVIHRNSNDSHSHTHVRVRGGIQFLLGDFESAIHDYDLAHLNTTGGHQSTILFERALVKCMLGRYSEAMHDVVAVITLNSNENDIQELQACIQQILDQQRAFQIVTESGSSCQRPLLPDQEKAMVKIPDFLTGDEWHTGKIGSLSPLSSGGSASGPPLKRAKSVGVARAADWSMTSIAEALKLQLKLTNRAQSLRMNPRYHVRRIRFIVNILDDECDPNDIVKLLSTEDQELLSWQAPTADLQGDLEAGSDLMCLSGRLCPYKNISHTLYSNVTDDDSYVQKRGPHPLSCYRHVSFRSAMLTKHSAPEGDVQTLLLYDGTPGDRSCWRWRSHDYVKELVLPGARSPYRAFWLVQWDVVDMWHVVQGGPDQGFCSNSASVERQDDLREFHSFRSPWIAEVAAAGISSPTSDGNGLNSHRGRDARTNPRMSIPVNEKPQTSRQTQPLKASGVDSVFITISENSMSGGDSTVDSSSMNAYDWKSIHELVLSEEDRRLATVPELPLQSKHRIFLSHSGAQRTFVNQLCLDLEQQLHHTLFFDKRSDSLPKGEDFPQKIFQAAQQCELAIVVLSEEYFSQSKWPMLELSAVVQSSKRKILPLFFGLSYKEFKDAERRERWFQRWEAWAQIDPRVSVKDWKLALREVERRIGLEYVAAVGEVWFREEVLAIVSAARVGGGGEGEDEWKSVDNFHYHNGDEKAVSEVLRSSQTHRISEEWNQRDEIQELKIENGLQVAVKRGSDHDMSRSIMEQESPVLTGLTLPSICKYIKISRTGLRLMKHDLCSIIDSRLEGLPEGSTPFTLPEAVDIMLQIGKAMAVMHDRNVAHRDLKSQNILCTPLHTLAESGSAFQPEHYYSVKLADFGLAKNQIQSSDGETLMAGASRYKAPEMLEVREFQRKADVYSFGILCCEILTGKLPFGEYRYQHLNLHARRPLDNLILQGVPEALKKLIHHCLDSNPAQRPTFDHIVMKLRKYKVQAHEDMGDTSLGTGPIPGLSTLLP